LTLFINRDLINALYEKILFTLLFLKWEIKIMNIFGESTMALVKYFKPLNVLLIFIAVNLTAAVKDQVGFDLALGTVVDINNEMIYVSHPEKGIEAISIDSGKVIWQSDEAARPIMIRDDQLIAQAAVSTNGTINLVSFNSNNGTVLSKKALVAPSKVLAQTSEGLEHKFNIQANYDTNPMGEIEWSYFYKVAQGIVPEQNLTGQAKDTTTYGQIKLSQAKQSSGQSVLDDATLITLSEKPLSKLIAMAGKFLQQDDGRQFASLSRNHVLVSQINDELSIWEKYKWNIYDMNNQLLGSFLHYNSFRPFEVVGDTVLFVTSPTMNAEGDKVIRHPYMLNAYSLSSGVEKWTHEVKDHKFNGPYPH